MFRHKSTCVLLAMVASAVLVVACDRKPGPDDVVIEEDIIVNDDPVAKDWIVEEIVPVPPRRPAVIAGPRPSKDHIWTPGEWKRENDAWVWESGRWMKPPHKHASWMEAHWRMETGKWHWTPGHWVLTNQPQHVNEMLTAPDLLSEVMPKEPSDQNHWIAGHWDWDGHWTWVGGYWTSKPDPDAEWVAGHWEEFGSEGGYRWIGGHWRIKD